MRKILKWMLFCCLVLFASINIKMPVQAEATEQKTIIGFECGTLVLDTYHIALEQKPSKEVLIEALPKQLMVYFAGETSATAIDVSWFDVSGDYDLADKAYYYQFSPKWDMEQYPLAESLELLTDVPYIAVFMYDAESGADGAAATNYKNETAVYNFLRNNFNLNTAAICGILANIQKESSFNPATYNGNDTGGTVSYGLCQWNNGAGAGNRYGKLRDWCTKNGYDHTTIEGQLNFMKYELKTTPYYKLATLENDIPNTAEGAYKASLLWSKYYEGCSKKYYEERANLAKNTYWPAYKGDKNTSLPFADVDKSDWFYDAVYYNYSEGLMTGKSETVFAPYEALARGQFASILYRINGSPSVTFKPVFSDVKDGLWYTAPILWVKSAGIANGYMDGRFGPGDVITREQMAIMMFNYANYLGYDTSERGDISTFKDASDVNHYAQNAMKWAVGAGIISGKNNGTILDPQGETVRVQCAVMIRNFMEKYDK